MKRNYWRERSDTDGYCPYLEGNEKLLWWGGSWISCPSIPSIHSHSLLMHNVPMKYSNHSILFLSFLIIELHWSVLCSAFLSYLQLGDNFSSLLVIQHHTVLTLHKQTTASAGKKQTINAFIIGKRREKRGEKVINNERKSVRLEEVELHGPERRSSKQE